MINEKKKTMEMNKMKSNKPKEFQTKRILNPSVIDKIIILSTFNKIKTNKNISLQTNKKVLLSLLNSQIIQTDKFTIIVEVLWLLIRDKHLILMIQ